MFRQLLWMRGFRSCAFRHATEDHSPGEVEQRTPAMPDKLSIFKKPEYHGIAPRLGGTGEQGSLFLEWLSHSLCTRPQIASHSVTSTDLLSVVELAESLLQNQTRNGSQESLDETCKDRPTLPNTSTKRGSHD